MSIPTEIPLDWRQSNDWRSFDHLVTIAPTVADHVEHKLGPVLDQGLVGACTGFGTVAALSALNPSLARKSHAMALYELATSRDPYPGDWPTADTGSSVNGAMRAARDLYRVASWTWAGSREALRTALGLGPVVIGSPWFDSMDAATPDGLVEVNSHSPLRGGHCFCAFGYDSFGVWCRNSWGRGWGRGGDFVIPWPSMSELFRLGAEAALPVLRG